MSNTLTISEALRSASEQLQPFTSSARIDAEALLCFVLQHNTAHFAAWPEKVLSENDALHFEQLILERSTGTPVAYLTGHREFWSLKLAVTADTLIPRPETETLIEFVLEECGNKKHCHPSRYRFITDHICRLRFTHSRPPPRNELHWPDRRLRNCRRGVLCSSRHAFGGNVIGNKNQ